MRQETIHRVQQFIYERFQEDTTGHDYHHMQRVASMAKDLAEKEGGDPFICEVAGWLHDSQDPKLVENPIEAKQEVVRLLDSCAVPQSIQNRIFQATEDVSYKTGHRVPVTLEGKLVQDADRLDAMGAIGIARAFAYGGSVRQPLHSEHTPSSVQHFYTKLLKLKDLLNTSSAKVVGEHRHQIMETFLKEFHQEWNNTTAT